MRIAFITLIAGIAVAAAFIASGSIHAGPVEDGTVQARLQALEDRDAIRNLFIEYGRTLDSRDFTAFGRLFAKDGEFVGGGPGGSAKGPQAIGTLLEGMIGKNYPDSKGKNFHLFFGESIHVNGDQATAVSKGGFVMANTVNKPEMLLLATYHDQFVREDGQWKFKRREIHSDIPVPKTPSH